MTRKLFGTDGIRGTANREPITAETALAVAKAAGRQFLRGDHRHTVVIGKDTRLSGYLLEPAMTAGFVSVGMDVVLLGPLPTPAVGMLTRSMRADLGVVISASHNPYEDNGIKLFGPDGYKLSDEVEQEIEARIDNGDSEGASPHQLGRAQRLDESGHGRYIEFVKSSFPRGLRLDGLKVVVDCANGAAYRVAPRVLYELGAEVVSIGVNPDGFNINQRCGATDPERMQEAVVTHNADFGIALDGDADRAILADEKGKVIDGDQVMARCVRSSMTC
jgi:phosphoglucosamine mutase